VPTHDGAEAEPLEARARTAVAAIPVDAITGARWSGLAGQEPTSVVVLDAFEFDDGGVLAILTALLPDGTAVTLTLPIEEAPPWSGLHRLATRGGSVAGLHGGRLVGRPGTAMMPGSPAAGPGNREPIAVRLSPADQTHTSVILDERSILKLYRRLTTGPNPEAEVLGALAAVSSAPVPAWHGAVELVPSSGAVTTLAIEQAFVPGVVDTFEFLADGLATWLAGDGERLSTDIATGSGIATGRLHAALAGVRGQAFLPRPATANDRAAWVEAAERVLSTAIGAVRPANRGLAGRLERWAPAIRRALRPLADPEIPVRLQRIHGDLHTGQILAVQGGTLLVDFEGDPTRDPTERRALRDPLRDVASFLRALDHVARSGYRRATAGAHGRAGRQAAAMRDGWINSSRGAFLAGYAAGLDAAAWSPPAAMLRALEVEKELSEFIYAATFLPEWLYAPTAAMDALLKAKR